MRLQIVVVGVGGGGIIFMAKTLAETALRLGYPVVGSETHGMSQRGGSVIAHLKLGDFHSPLVRRGAADALIALNAVEAMKSLDYLRSGGKCIVNSGDGQFPGPALEGYTERRGLEIAALDADAIALDLGSPAVANMALLGFAAAHGALPFGVEELIDTVTAISAARLRATNADALKRGAQAITAGEGAR